MSWVPFGFQNIEIMSSAINRQRWPDTNLYIYMKTTLNKTLLNVHTIIIIVWYGNHSTHLTSRTFHTFIISIYWLKSKSNIEIPRFYFDRRQSRTNGNTFSSQRNIVCFDCLPLHRSSLIDSIFLWFFVLSFILSAAWLFSLFLKIVSFSYSFR